jgi:hypothetical protein
MRRLFIGPSLIPAAVSAEIGLRPSPHATVQGGLELFGSNCATNNQTHQWESPLLASPPSRAPCSRQRERFSRSQHRGDDQQYHRPRFDYHDVDFGTEVVGARNSHSGLGNGGNFEFQNRPCVTGSTGCGRGNQPLSQGLWRYLGRG